MNTSLLRFGRWQQTGLDDPTKIPVYRRLQRGHDASPRWIKDLELTSIPEALAAQRALQKAIAKRPEIEAISHLFELRLEAVPPDSPIQFPGMVDVLQCLLLPHAAIDGIQKVLHLPGVRSLVGKQFHLSLYQHYKRIGPQLDASINPLSLSDIEKNADRYINEMIDVAQSHEPILGQMDAFVAPVKRAIDKESAPSIKPPTQQKPVLEPEGLLTMLRNLAGNLGTTRLRIN